MRRIRLVLADDHALIRETLCRLLEPEFDVIAAVEDGDAAIAQSEKLQPDLVVLDVGLPLVNGIEAARQILQRVPRAKIIMLTQQSGKEYVEAAFHNGASAYVLKSTAASELPIAIREAFDGSQYVSPSIKRSRPHISPDGNSPDGNSPDGNSGGRQLLMGRRREVLRLTAQGKTHEQISQILGMSVRGVEFQKASIMEQFHLKDASGLLKFARDQGLV